MSDVRFAETEQERNLVYRLRYEVYIERQKKAYVAANHGARQFTDDLDNGADIIYAENDGRAIATCRYNWGRDVETQRALIQRFPFMAHLDLDFDLFCFCSRLIICQERPKLTLEMLEVGYRLARKRGVVFYLMHTAVRLVPVFQRLGAKQVGPPFSDYEIGPQVPLVLALDDLEHLDRIRSPFRLFAKEFPVTGLARHLFERVSVTS